MMLTGITDIELIPPASGKIDLSHQIKALFTEAKAIRAAIAFWTLSPNQLAYITDGNAQRVFNDEKSFLCVDIQRPTNIDNLANLVAEGAKVFLNIRKLPKALDRLKISTSRGLLHTKFLVADQPNGKAEIWIGSHNWTLPALIGPNTEISTSLKLTSKAPLYSEAKFRLEDIRDNYCQPFDINKTEYYKELQKAFETKTKSKNVIELEGYDIDNLAGQAIHIFGSEGDDYNALSEVNKKIFLSIYESSGRGSCLYQARILQTGLLASANSQADGITLPASRHAFTVRRSFPHLGTIDVPGPDILDKAIFFVTIEITEFVTSKFALYDTKDYVKPPRWTNPEWDPSIKRMNPDLFKYFYGYQVSIRDCIHVSSEDEKAEKSYFQSNSIEYSSIPIEQKRIGNDYCLISKRVIEY